MHRIDVEDAPTGVTVRSDFVVRSPRNSDRERATMKLQTVIRTSMRAYLTVAGMALGLVALWAALAPLLA
jgi:hypothetical protein